MCKINVLMILILTMVLTAATAFGQEYVVADFEGGVNNGGWWWGPTWGDVVETEGGNPGGYLGNAYQDTYYPILKSEWDESGFTGNLTEAVNISGDFQTFSSSNPWIGDFYFTVLFRNHMGTPNDFEDDVFVYIDPYNYDCPDIGEGWKHYEFDLPFDFEGALGELPAGWVGGSYATGNATFPSDITFQEVVSNIGRVEFWFNHPDWAAIFATFNTGADNIVLEYIEGAVATESASWGSVKTLYR